MNRINFATLICLSFFLTLTAAGQQNKQQIEELYKDANAYFYFEDYEEALALYLKIHNSYTDNFNLDYRIGFCYLNIPGRKHLAVPYLERASKNITKRYSDQSIKEMRAPVEALFYLGNAYFINNQLNKAQQAYDQFLESIRSEKLYDMDYMTHQVNSIKRSKTIRSYPVNFLRSNLGTPINDHLPNYNPVVSGDGQTLAFTTKQKFYQAIYVARKEGDKWGTPRNITLDLVVDGNCTTLSLSYSGDELYLFKDVDHVGNIYVSNYKNGKWSPMRKLNDNINTQHYETHACVSADGTKLFFSSNRAGGYGDLDIYVSERVPGGDWGPATNLGPNINSRFNENTPFVTTDGNTLYFSSEGHNTMGGYDIFFSQKQSDGTWSKPVNMGYPINSTDDDLFYFPIGDGSVGLMALFANDAIGETDIYQLEIFLPRYQKSIVTSSDYFEKKDYLPKRTLVIDTANVQGVALIDPVKSENIAYLDPEKRFTLFFEGKAYNLKDQSNIKEIIAAKMEAKPVREQEQLKTIDIIGDLTKDLNFDLQRDLSSMNRLAEHKSDSVAVIPQPMAVTLDTGEEKTKPVADYISEDDIERVAREAEWLTKILTVLADKNINPLILQSFDKTWQNPKTIHNLWAARLAHLADSLGIAREYLDMLAELLDAVNKEYMDMQYRQSRKISFASQIEEFFFKFQSLKRKASPALADILDYAVLTNPDITSFVSLWNYLKTQKEKEIAPYISELLQLFAETAFEGFFELSPKQKENVYKTIHRNHSHFGTNALFGTLVLVAAAVILFFLIKRNRREELNE